MLERLWDDVPMTVGKGKRPRDPNQLAKWLVDNSTAEPAPVVPVPSDLSLYMAAMGRKGGQSSGKQRLVTMTKEQRRKVAVKAAKARWKKRGQNREQIAGTIKRLSLTHMLLLVIAVFLCLIWLQMRSIDRSLHAIDCDMPDLPCIHHY